MGWPLSRPLDARFANPRHGASLARDPHYLAPPTHPAPSRLRLRPGSDPTSTSMNATTCLRWAGALGALGVAAGAFGAHGLRDTLAPDRLEVWETAARYELVHAVALVALASAWHRQSRPGTTATLWVAGTLVFSGSLYALCLTDVGALGAVTPFGGAAMIAGWISLLVGATSGPDAARHR